MANEGSKIASQPTADKAMDDVLGAVAKLITGMETIGCLRSKPRARARARASDFFSHVTKTTLALALGLEKASNFGKSRLL
jgi:hypothetical protein